MRNADEYKQLDRTKSNQGRFPSNVILTYNDTDYAEVCGGFPFTINSKRSPHNNKDTVSTNTYTPPKAIYTDDNTYGDSGSASRYFYCAKASKKDRDEGLENFEEKERFQQGNYSQSPVCSVCGKTFNGTNDHSLCGEHTMIYKSKEENSVRKNIHPTVKPTELMQYLVRLICPCGAVILDPFMGSGSTGKAVAWENVERNKQYKFIGIEQEPEYCQIAEARIQYALGNQVYIEKDENDIEVMVVKPKIKQHKLF